MGTKQCWFWRHSWVYGGISAYLSPSAGDHRACSRCRKHQRFALDGHWWSLV